MPKNVYLPENFPKIEEVREVENYIPTYEEFLRTYETEQKVSDSYRNELNSYSDIRVSKNFGPMYRASVESATNRRTWTTPIVTPLPSIRNVEFNTTGSSKFDNYRVIGTVFGGLVGNLIGGVLEDRSMCIPSGTLFTSERRNPLSFQFFWQTATMNRIPGTDRVDFHNDKISCRSKDHLVELRDKIGSIVEICEFYTFSAYNRPSKEQDFKDKVQDLLYKHSEGEDVNGSYTIY